MTSDQQRQAAAATPPDAARRRRIWPTSLQGRLLTGVLGGVLLLWLATALATWHDARKELDELLDSHLAQAAALLVARDRRGDGGDDDGLAGDAPLLHRYAPKVAFQVWHEGVLVLRSANAPTAAMSGVAHGFDTLRIDGAPWRVFGAQGAERDVQVFVGEQLASRGSILWAVMRSMLWPMAIAWPLLALAIWVAVRQGLRPLRQLSRVLAQRAPDALQPVTLGRTPRAAQPQVPVDAAAHTSTAAAAAAPDVQAPAAADVPAELQPLLAALNGLFERIAALLDAERRFTADAAHELRTPIAAIRTQAQVALGASDAAARCHALESTLAGCDRATRLVEQLLMLARLEAAPQGALAVVDLGALARTVAAELAPSALARQQWLELDAAAPCPVRAEPTLLGVLLRNLIDNAIRYSQPRSRILLTLSAHQGQALLCLEDSGPGLAEADAVRLGERFFRVLGSGQSGSGLGWSIVRRIAASHGATLVVGRSTALGGLRVELRLPLDDARAAAAQAPAR